MRTTEIPELPLPEDATLTIPQRIAQGVRALVDSGALSPGDPVPATRPWAQRLGVSRSSVVAAYDQLAAEGYLAARRGSATRVNPRLALLHPRNRTGTSRPGTRAEALLHPTAPHPAATAPHPGESVRGASPAAAPPAAGPRARPPRPGETPHRHAGASQTDRAPGAPTPIDLLPDRPATDALRTPAWRRAWREAADAVPRPLPPAGAPALRREITEHLRHMRGLVRTPDDLLVTAGAREGLALLLRTLQADAPRGGRALRVGVEAPGYPSLRRVATALGATLVPLAADASGLVTDRLPDAAPDVVIVTPSHQYPLGGSLPIDRRRQLLGWAAAHRVVVVEDDYDSELRYVGQPLPALAALDDPVNGVVVTLGTFSKTVAPEVGVGFVIAPDGLRARMLRLREVLGCPVSGVVQTAFTGYLRSGELRRHTARMRRRYRQRRDRVLAVLGPVPGVEVLPMDGGLHAVVRVPGDVDEGALQDACAAAGLRTAPLSRYWRGAAPRPRPMAGLVIGYAHLEDRTLDEGLARLRQVLRSVSPRSRR